MWLKTLSQSNTPWVLLLFMISILSLFVMWKLLYSLIRFIMLFAPDILFSFFCLFGATDAKSEFFESEFNYRHHFAPFYRAEFFNSLQFLSFFYWWKWTRLFFILNLARKKNENQRKNWMEKSKSNLHICLFVCMYFAFKNGAVTLLETQMKRNERKNIEHWAMALTVDLYSNYPKFGYSHVFASPFTVFARMWTIIAIIFIILIELFWRNTNLLVSLLYFVGFRCAKISDSPVKRNTLD